MLKNYVNVRRHRIAIAVEWEKFIQVNSCGKFKEKCFRLKICIKALARRLYLNATRFISLLTLKTNIKFIVQNLWIQIYDKDFGGMMVAGYLWRTLCTHNEDEKCVYERNNRQEGLKYLFYFLRRRSRKFPSRSITNKFPPCSCFCFLTSKPSEYNAT